MRQFALSEKKLRNIPRRKRALARWAAHFAGRVVAPHADERCCHWKIPVHLHMVQGQQTTPELQTFCIQQLLIAAQHLLTAAPAPPSHRDYRVACLIVWPYLHQSEVTIFYQVRRKIPPFRAGIAKALLWRTDAEGVRLWKTQFNTFMVSLKRRGFRT